MQDLCHATRYIRTSSNPTGGILSFYTFQFLGLYFFMCFFFCVCCSFVFFVLIFCIVFFFVLYFFFFLF